MHRLFGKGASFLVATLITALAASAYAAGGRTLWTTQEDFSQWNAYGDESIAPVATPDSDGSSVNGNGNSTAPGATGTPGALQITWNSGTYDSVYSSSIQTNLNLLSYMGTQGVMQFDYIRPTIHVGSYFQLGVVFNYNNHYDFFSGSDSATANANGYTTNTFAYTFDATQITSSAGPYFQMTVTFNSDWSPLDPYYADNFRLIGHGDLNGDGHVDTADIQTMEAALTNPTAWETTYGLSAANLTTIGDFNADGNFTNADLQGFLNYLIAGNGSVTTVPEPGSLLLLGLAMPGFIVAARRLRKAV
jgi:Dockerin type I domain/PEP-CTERM motif